VADRQAQLESSGPRRGRLNGEKGFEMNAVDTILFRIRRSGRAWLVMEETHEHALGGIFSTLAAALQFVDGEAARYQQAEAVVDLSRASSPLKPPARR
jgi:hypothetical protein